MQWTSKLKSAYAWGKHNLKNPLKCDEFWKQRVENQIC